MDVKKKPKGKKGDLTGRPQWDLTILRRVEPQEQDVWEALCKCGKVVELKRDKLLRARSCGCRASPVAKVLIYGTPALTLGKELTEDQLDVYQIWYGMNTRCAEKSSFLYPGYGGRGIKVCRRWKSFTNFFKDMGPRPSKDHTIERENVNGNYEPINCSWLHKSLQARNTRQTVRVIYRGHTVTLIDFLETHTDLKREDFKFLTEERKKNGKAPFDITEIVTRLRELKERENK